MKVRVIDIFDYTVLVEYEDNKTIQRQFISRGSISERGKLYSVSKGILDQSINYSNVSLIENLGEEVRPIYEELKLKGIWTVEDYKNNPTVVHQVAKKYGSDAAIIISAAVRGDNNAG